MRSLRRRIRLCGNTVIFAEASSGLKFKPIHRIWPPAFICRATGVVVADVDPGSPAHTAGVQPQDIVTTVDGAPIGIVPMFGLAMSSHAPGMRSRWDCCEERPCSPSMCP